MTFLNLQPLFRSVMLAETSAYLNFRAANFYLGERQKSHNSFGGEGGRLAVTFIVNQNLVILKKITREGEGPLCLLLVKFYHVISGP